MQDHVGQELSIEGLELRHSLLHTILALVIGPIDKASPHDNAPMRLQRFGKHIRSVGMRALVVARPRLSLAVGFHEEASEVGHQAIDGIHLLAPPLSHLRVQRVGCWQTSQRHRRGEIDAQVSAYSIALKIAVDHTHLLQPLIRKHLGRSIYIIDNDSVDTQAGVGTGIIGHPVRESGIEDALARIAALHTAIEVIPVVDEPEVKGRMLLLGTDIAQLLHPQQVEGRIEQTVGSRRRQFYLSGSDHYAVCIALQGILLQLHPYGHRSPVVGLQLIQRRPLGAAHERTRHFILLTRQPQR